MLRMYYYPKWICRLVPSDYPVRRLLLHSRGYPCWYFLGRKEQGLSDFAACYDWHVYMCINTIAGNIVAGVSLPADTCMWKAVLVDYRIGAPIFSNSP